ncbi:hypothetical protein [Kitasatospora sp. NPDC057223]|uniref:hypothetical protein n=1 Tax=Kitasatospora sp. NPDC057223 TaxID=3346055 RepID=UPI00363C21FF
MFAVHLTLRPDPPAALPAGGAGPTYEGPTYEGVAGERVAAAVQEALWEFAGPADGLEHIRARSGPRGLGLVLFIRAPDRSEAERRARALLGRALAEGAVGPFAPAPP